MTVEQEKQLQAWVRAQNTPQGVAVRWRIVLKAAASLPNQRIAEELRVSRPTVLLWRRRFVQTGCAALTQIEAGRGRKASVPATQVKEIVEATLKTRPKGATHWSCRTMAKTYHVSPATIQRIWHAHGLQPHRVKTFKLSRHQRFLEKLTDVVGLYLNPPDKAVALCVDEKSQIQALQ